MSRFKIENEKIHSFFQDNRPMYKSIGRLDTVHHYFLFNWLFFKTCDIVFNDYPVIIQASSGFHDQKKDIDMKQFDYQMKWFDWRYYLNDKPYDSRYDKVLTFKNKSPDDVKDKDLEEIFK